MSEIILSKVANQYDRTRLQFSEGPVTVPVGDFISDLILPIQPAEQRTARRLIVEGVAFQELAKASDQLVEDEDLKVLPLRETINLSDRIGVNLSQAAKDLYFDDRLLYIPTGEAFLRAWRSSQGQSEEAIAASYGSSFILTFYNYCAKTRESELSLPADEYYKNRLGFFAQAYANLDDKKEFIVEQERTAKVDHQSKIEDFKPYQVFLDEGDTVLSHEAFGFHQALTEARDNHRKYFRLLKNIEVAQTYAQNIEQWSRE